MDKESNEGGEKSVKGQYEGRFTKEGGGSFYGIIIFFGALGFAERELSSVVGRISTGAPVCWRFWARGPGYPYDILELGSCPSWQGGTRFGQCLHSSAKVNRTSGQTEG
jgi:hypothetical protein